MNLRNWFRNLINYYFYFRKENDFLKKLKMIIFTSIFDIDYFSLNYRIWFSQPWMVTMFASLLTDKQEVERLSPWSETETRGFLESLRGLLIEFTVWLTKLGKLVFYLFFFSLERFVDKEYKAIENNDNSPCDIMR